MWVDTLDVIFQGASLLFSHWCEGGTEVGGMMLGEVAFVSALKIEKEVAASTPLCRTALRVRTEQTKRHHFFLRRKKDNHSGYAIHTCAHVYRYVCIFVRVVALPEKS